MQTERNVKTPKKQKKKKKIKKARKLYSDSVLTDTSIRQTPL